jgi:rhamnopyranosyl-N-acetylglucosaminyl-diphospho-decaprenol beta-1,3/1,4-galactofuranosyltransferase
MKEILAVIVTHNRLKDLKICIDSLEKQTYTEFDILIVNNGCTDGTMDYLKTKDNIKIVSQGNEGSSGGQYAGFEYMYANGYKWLWTMDDDGRPDVRCLESLLKHAKDHDYISPLVISKEDKTKCAFYDYSVEEFCLLATDGLVNNLANPFNGVLFSRYLIEKVGFPKKDLFIWGDENNYQLRCVNLGFSPVTCINAIHYHPRDKQQIIKTLFKKKAPITTINWKLYCLVRNFTYNILYVRKMSMYSRLATILDYYVSCGLYFIRQRNFKLCFIVIKAAKHGITKDFTHLNDYFNI